MAQLRLENSIVDGRYRVSRCLSRGSYAEIFVATDEGRAGQPVIIKALNTSLQGTLDLELERTLVENFQNEAVALDRVRHPNIIQRLGHGTAADLDSVPFHYLLLEYMPGGDMLAFCRKRPLDLKSTAEYVRQVADALAYAHSRQVIHRDLKPNNLLLSQDHLTVKIADFGVAKVAMDDAMEITRVGTNIYAPPEHHPDGESESGERLTPSADIYSLAKTIFTMLTGRPPRQYSRRPVSSLPVELAGNTWGNRLLEILRKATADRATERYSSVQEFWEDFSAISTVEEAAGELDPEATIVRRRLGRPVDVQTVAEKPSFGALTHTGEGVRSGKPRIVVELPKRKFPEPDSVTTSIQSTLRPMPARQGTEIASVPSRHSEAVEYETRAGRALAGLRSSTAATLMRWVFILFLVAALIGVVTSTFNWFSGRRVDFPAIFGVLGYPEGLISGASNVNLRMEPNRQAEVLVWLPEGTRVRVIENRGGWARVEVIAWAGSRPENSPRGGWVDGRFIQYD